MFWIWSQCALQADGQRREREREFEVGSHYSFSSDCYLYKSFSSVVVIFMKGVCVRYMNG